MFYVMSFEDGRIFWNPALPEVPVEERGAIYDALLGTMAALHDVDVDAGRIADYGRPGNYFERQIESVDEAISRCADRATGGDGVADRLVACALSGGSRTAFARAR